MKMAQKTTETPPKTNTTSVDHFPPPRFDPYVYQSTALDVRIPIYDFYQKVDTTVLRF